MDYDEDGIENNRNPRRIVTQMVSFLRANSGKHLGQSELRWPMLTLLFTGIVGLGSIIIKRNVKLFRKGKDIPKVKSDK